MNVQNISKKIAKRFGLNYMLKPVALEILRLLGEGETQSTIAKMTGYRKTRVNYWTLKFLADELIVEIGKGKPKFYELTAFGSKILTGSERGYREPLIMEDYPLKYRLIDEYGTVDWKKLGNPKNWIKMGIRVAGIRVEKNLGKIPTIIIHTGQLKGFNQDELLVEAAVIIQTVRSKLWGMKILTDDWGVPLHEPVFKSYPPEAELLNSYGTIESRDGKIDHSKRDKNSHIERGLVQQQDYLAMPRRVKQQVKNVEHIDKNVKDMKGELQELVSYMSSIAETQKFILENQAQQLIQYNFLLKKIESRDKRMVN